MRWAFLADVHGNLEALRAVLRDLEDWPDHRLVCAGDIVGYGPDPEPCLDLLVERGAICVAGNHEGMVLGRIGFEHCVHAGIVAAVWTRGRLSRAALERLASLPMVARPSPEIAVCHAMPDDVLRYITSAPVAERALAQVRREAPGAELLVGGHTHFAAFHAWPGVFRHLAAGAVETVAAGRPHMVNPGSVGQPRDGVPVARYARYDSIARTVSWRSVEYDSAPTLAKMREAGLVARVCYAFPQTWIQRKFDDIRTRRTRERFQPLAPIASKPAARLDPVTIRPE